MKTRIYATPAVKGLKDAAQWMFTMTQNSRDNRCLEIIIDVWYNVKILHQHVIAKYYICFTRQ